MIGHRSQALSRGVVVGLTLVGVCACGASDQDSAPQFSTGTPTADLPTPSPPTGQRPSPSAPSSPRPTLSLPTATETVTAGPTDGVLPGDLIGTWRGLDQGTAEVVYRFRPDGTFESAEVLMQERPSGFFTFTVAATGSAAVIDGVLVLTQEDGRETMQDPDSPSSNYDRPLTPLEKKRFAWSMDGDLLTLEGQYGVIRYERIEE